MRIQPTADALCFIGAAPAWVAELTMTGHSVYQLPADTVLQKGQRAFKPLPSSIGVRWTEVVVGETSIQFN